MRNTILAVKWIDAYGSYCMVAYRNAGVRPEGSWLKSKSVFWRSTDGVPKPGVYHLPFFGQDLDCPVKHACKTEVVFFHGRQTTGFEDAVFLMLSHDWEITLSRSLPRV